MPSTVASLLAVAGLESGGCVDWGARVPETRTRVYLVSLTSTGRVANALTDCPLGDAAVDELLISCPALTLDGEHPTRAQVAERIGSYWLPDECVLYIGLAGQPLRTRVRQYYKTRIGAAKPHKGGWWLKALSVLGELHVHYAPTDDFEGAEEQMLRAFAAAVSRPERPGRAAHRRSGDSVCEPARWRLAPQAPRHPRRDQRGHKVDPSRTKDNEGDTVQTVDGVSSPNARGTRNPTFSFSRRDRE